MARISRRRRQARSPLASPPDQPSGGVKALIDRAKLCLGSVGIEPCEWSASTWCLSPSIFKLTGRNVQTVSISFLGNDAPPGNVGQEWEDAIKAIFVLRQHRSVRSITSHRTFIKVVRYIAQCAKGRALCTLTPEVLDAACEALSHSTDSDQQKYKFCCMVAEFARHWCAAFGLCRVDLADYRFSNVTRPSGYGGDNSFRLDSVASLDTSSNRVLTERSLQLLGKLYEKVPKNHAYRIYILLLVLLFCIGRRFSEVSNLPRKCIVRRSDGYYLKYIQMKEVGVSEKRKFTLVPVPKLVVKLLRDVIAELKWSSRRNYSVAKEMLKQRGPDLRFLDDISDKRALFQKDLARLGLPQQCLSKNGWFEKNGRIRWQASGQGGRPFKCVFKRDVVDFCRVDYSPWMHEQILNISSEGFFLSDLLFLRQYGTSSGFYAHWIVRPISHSMLATTLRYMDKLTSEYCSGCFDQHFTSHMFRHTLNDALDKGGLSDLMQTDFFGRKYAADTKSYQHSSPQYRALQVREKIKLGEVGGAIAERVMNLPVDQQEIYLNSEVRSAHDLGLGICLHVWSHGPCPKHLECTSGCDKFSWLTGLEGDAQAEQIFEVKRQICTNLLVLCNAFEPENFRIGAVQSWITHLFKKISNLKRLLCETSEQECGLDQFGEFWMKVMPKAPSLDRFRIDRAHAYYLLQHEKYLSLVEVAHG